MIGTAREIFGDEERKLFKKAERLVELFPEEDLQGHLLRCHEVARVVGACLDIQVMDGRYEYGAEHSWCVIEKVKYRGFTILDPYAIGQMPIVKMLCVIPTIPNRYFPENFRDDIRFGVIAYLADIAEKRRDHWDREACK